MTWTFLLACTGEVVSRPDDSADTALAPLAISELEPAEGPVGGGTTIRIRGAGFTSGSTASVGGRACASLTFLSGAELFCVTPAGSEGAAQLEVVEGDLTAAAEFTYLPEGGDTGPDDTAEPIATIDACELVSPTSFELPSGEFSEDILGSVTVAGRTEGEGDSPGIELELGWGRASEPVEDWVWDDMNYSVSSDPADVYTGALYIEPLGEYAYGVRARVDHSAWTYCPTASGAWGEVLVTEPITEIPVDYCHLQWPCSTSVAAGATSESVYAWIYQGGVTTEVGQGDGVLFELGVGNAGSDPETDPSWAWSSMTYLGDKDGLLDGDVANDEYVGTFLAPTTAGTYDYVARASADYGLSYTLCDLGGDSCNFGGSSDGYDDPAVCTVN